MNTLGDGGAAFPQHGWTKDPKVLRQMAKVGYGLSKRELFAAAALIGIIGADHGGDRYGNDLENKTKSAYQAADWMLLWGRAKK